MVHRDIKTLYIPDLLQDWPWPREINPHYEEVKEESNAWLRRFSAFSTPSQCAFEKGDFQLLAALTYPRVSKEHLRTGCDLLNLFFLVDEYTDVEPSNIVREMLDVVIDAMSKPHEPRPEGEIILGEVARQFWALATETASPTSQRHRIESFTAYLNSVVQEADDRDHDTHRSISSYLELRRETVGVHPSCMPLELGLSIPDEIFYHPAIRQLSLCIVDMIIVDNDIASYNRENAVGDHHNLLTVVMRELDTDLDGALNWAINYFNEAKNKFLEGLVRVPSWGHDIDLQVEQYMHAIANVPRGSSCWDFEGGRYFGSKGLEYQRTRVVPLLPKVTPPRQDPTLRRQNIVVADVDALETGNNLCT